jgi:hypothetical protein
MPVTLVGYSAGDTSATLPPHQAGDFILAYAWNNDSGSITQPAGWTSMRFTQQSGSPTVSSRSAYLIATGSDHVSGTWTQAELVLFFVLRGAGDQLEFGSTSISPSASNVFWSLNPVQHPNVISLYIRDDLVTDFTSFKPSGHTQVVYDTHGSFRYLLNVGVQAVGSAVSFSSTAGTAGNRVSYVFSVGDLRSKGGAVSQQKKRKAQQNRKLAQLIGRNNGFRLYLDDAAIGAQHPFIVDPTVDEV